MILLNGHSLAPARKVPVEALSLQLKERDSTATMTPADMTGITVNSWVRDEGNPGDGIVWRVKSISQAYATATPTLQLEHMISSLKDTILFGEHKPAQITGNAKATTCTAEQAIRYVLSKQSDWTLGSFGFGGVANPYKFDGDTLFDCLETISNSLTDAWWSYDMSRYPFRLNITQKSGTVQSELRASRNLRTITKTIDKSGMYTRFYPIGKNDLHIDGDYVERNVAAYGVISKVETDQSIDTKAELTRWANERLQAHAEPTVTIDVDGLELADATGESLDRLRLGAVCRIPLQEFGTTITERIVSLTYQDKAHQPEVVKVQLSNVRQDLTKILADALKSGGRGSRTTAKRDKEDFAWFEDTNDHVAMCAKGIVGVDAAGNPNWVRLSQIYVDGTGIHQQVQGVQGELVIAQTRIDMNENAIVMEAKRASDEEGKLSSRITVTANAITQEVTRATAAEGTLSGRITTEAGRISLVVEGTGANAKVKTASIVAAINDGDSSIAIDADHVNITGTTKINDVFVVTNGALGVKKPAIFTDNVDINSTGNLNVYTINLKGSTDVTLDRSVMSDVVIKAAVDGSTLKLWTMGDDKSGTPSITFSKAVSQSGAWSSGQLTVTATIGGVSASTFNQYIVDSGQKQNADGTAYTTGNVWYVPVNYKNNPYDASSIATGTRIHVDATERYNSGYSTAAGKMGWPSQISGQTTKDQISITFPTSSGGTNSRTFTLSKDSGGAYLRMGSTLVARVT